jgi:DNA-nicking Smr family endonuclease
MKKDKTSARPAAEFAASPFAALKGFSPKPAAKTANANHAKKKSDAPGDEAEMFLRAVGDVRRRRSEDEHGDTAAAAPQPDPAEQERRLFLSEVLKIGAAVPVRRKSRDELPVCTGRRSVGSRMRQLKRGTLRIGRELDLHGCFRDEALGRLGRFIAGACRDGLQAVLVITGKGNNSSGGAVLHGAASSWLTEHGEDMVAEFAPAPRTLGGDGAFVVFLRARTN